MSKTLHNPNGNNVDVLEKEKAIEPSNEWWNNFKNYMGFNPQTDEVPEKIVSALYSLGMITAHADRWKTGHQGMSTKGVLSDSVFKQGGHVFEGWDTEDMYRLTMIIGKFTQGRCHIFSFKPNSSGVETFGTITVGSDHEYKGMDFTPNYAHMWGTVSAENGFVGKDNWSSQKYYGGISGADRTKPLGANMEVTATANSIPNRVQFNECTNGMKIPVLATDPTVLEDGVFWFNSTESKFKGVISGQVKTFTMS
jgi:hypothetical protein